MNPQSAPKPATGLQTPPLPFADPGKLGLSPVRLQRMRDIGSRRLRDG